MITPITLMEVFISLCDLIGGKKMKPKSMKSAWIKYIKTLKENNPVVYYLLIKKIEEQGLDPYSPTKEVLMVNNCITTTENI